MTFFMNSWGDHRFWQRLTACAHYLYFLAAPFRRRNRRASLPPSSRSVALLVIHGPDLVGGGATASPDLPLAPADTSSPRATLQSFITAVDAIYADLNQTTQSTERRVRFKRRMIRIANCLDLSQVPPSLVGSKRQQVAVNIKEVFDRIKLPASEEIPDAERVAAEKLAHWRVPDTEITLVRVGEGPRAG